ncbi:flagellar hook-length control protein FliK [Rheinheimera sp. 1928-s]|uniref:flagellar hook-length control protein FliK n=1 Tax=Rheinheimera sp. 1928-s TaxID=3033803 RepID=UPI00262CC6CE|nr:flagellar hook-length control protein FliK [Rheinheimera sp. 1928-s]MDF3125152.1 flagellar hook-length control protein FliK [Rheinheimera sp. 1928-s]
MTMPVFASFTAVAVPQPLTQGRPALTDYSDSQQQSYSEDAAVLLATMEAALAELDTELQHLPEVTDPSGLVQSMLPPPLLFAPLPVALETLPVAESAEPVMPVLAPELVIQKSSEEDWVAPALISAGLTKLSEPSALPAPPVAVMPLHPEQQTRTAAQPLLPQLERSADLPAPVVVSVSQHVADLRLQNTSSLMSALSQHLSSQINPFASVNSQLLNPELLAPVTATATGHQAGATLPVWQADPLPAQSQHWGQRLVQMLADKVDLQLGLNVNKAMIRLDPPSLGSIELSVQLDGDRLTVQMHSSNAQLRDAMAQGLEQLRASLQQKLGSEVQIDLRMGTESSSQQQQQKFEQQLTQQTDANFYAEPDMTLPAAPQASPQNLINQLV